MELAPGSRAKDPNKIKHGYGGRMGLNSDTLLVIKLPDSTVLRVISRSVFLALVFITFPCIGSILRGSTDSVSSPAESGVLDFEQLDLLLHDLGEEGLVRKSDKALVVCPGVPSMIHENTSFDVNQMEVVLDSALEGQSSLSEESFDFVYTSNLAVDVKLVDRVVKIGGILAFPLSSEQVNNLRDKTNYKIVYLRRYSSTIVAMRKIGSMEASVASSFAKRRLFESATEAKKAAALQDLEEVLLEPPRRHSENSKNYSRKIKFLPQLMGDSLDSFRRRVFVNVGLPEENKDVTRWFHGNYPKMKQEFEVYDLDLVPEESSSGVAPPENDISDWLSKNVNEEEYVVMKAEAEVVEEMMKRKAIHLVDELFLECNNQWWKGSDKSKRAYWECLDLYGRIKDEGVAVHQWWG